MDFMSGYLLLKDIWCEIYLQLSSSLAYFPLDKS